MKLAVSCRFRELLYNIVQIVLCYLRVVVAVFQNFSLALLDQLEVITC